MSNHRSVHKISTCAACGLPFDVDARVPCTQNCQHSFCMPCIKSEETSIICPIDNKQIILSKVINQPLLTYINRNVIETSFEETCRLDGHEIEHYLEQIALILKEDPLSDGSNISPQLRRKLVHLIEATFSPDPDARYEFVRRITAVFNRLLLETVQAHYNTKQRQDDLRRLISSKKISIDYPDLTNAVIDRLIKLYKAPGQCADTSYERKVLIGFLLKELGGHGDRRQVERVVQTLYKSSCFNITKMDGASSRFKLKDELSSAQALRQRHDIELIKLAQTKRIRLPPESWANLLYGKCYSDNTPSRIQSLLEKHQPPVTVAELESTILEVGDKYDIQGSLWNLRRVQDLSKMMLDEQVTIEPEPVKELLSILLGLGKLFTIRQKR